MCFVTCFTKGWENMLIYDSKIICFYSEIRLMEIVEGLCESSSFECNHMVEEHEEHFETWWFKRCVTVICMCWLNSGPDSVGSDMWTTQYRKSQYLLSQFRKTKHSDLHKWFCIETIKVCCPKGTFGRDCSCECRTFSEFLPLKNYSVLDFFKELNVYYLKFWFGWS